LSPEASSILEPFLKARSSGIILFVTGVMVRAGLDGSRCPCPAESGKLTECLGGVNVKRAGKVEWTEVGVEGPEAAAAGKL
jgi:hypothetical protein